MTTLDNWLTRLETRLQALVEGSLQRLLPSKRPAERRSEPASTGEIELEHTAPLAVMPAPSESTQPLPAGAFLVVAGERLFPLEKGSISIGRALENDLVLADGRVSRQHVQLRAISGRYVVFDLDSSGGTTLNGRPISHHPLSPGDVLLLAGVPLVYGQESPTGLDHTHELNVGGES